ncbi:MAG: type III secretion fhipep protein [Thermomicrobiales bacterium]|nr:type III secretion fhipep protein [Thermomicrobiales bacterium]MCA9881047.1 type III secretion fhipep protein [Thermomicrobiales bacterium]
MAHLPRPAHVCAQLIKATEASEGRRKRRKRNTTPDSIGMEIKRGLMDAAIIADPDPEDFEEWLYQQVLLAGPLSGATRAMAMQIHDEWQFALASAGFRDWLAEGAPSDDSRPGRDQGLDPR